MKNLVTAKKPAASANPADARTGASRRSLAPAKSERGLKRREAILDAATAEFLGKGYRGASLRAIMAVAGGSSRTLYRQFGDKAGLFRAIVGRLEASITNMVVSYPQGDRSIEEELFEIGLTNLSSLLKPEHLAFYRLMVAESANGSDLPMLVWSVTHKLVVAKLAGYLRAKSALEGLNLEDPDIAAVQFIEASKGALHLEVLFGGRRPTYEEMAERVRAAVKTFLNGVRGPLSERHPSVAASRSSAGASG